MAWRCPPARGTRGSPSRKEKTSLAGEGRLQVMRGWVLVLGAAIALLATGRVAAQVVNAPAIGGSAAAFEQMLGAANDGTIGPQLHYLRCAGTDVDQFVVMAPNDQVWTIEREYCQPGQMTPDQRFAEAASLLPPDSIAGEALTTDEGDPALTYVSQTLGSALPAALFHDCAGQAVPAGTVVIVADADGGWFMGPGTCA
jgi:hypothetical protein